MYRHSYRLFLSLLVFSPLAFGTVAPWSQTIMVGLSLCALVLLLREHRKSGAPLYRVPGIIPLLCLWLYIGMQLMPLPAGAVRVISPETYALYAETIGSVAPVEWISLTVNKKSTLMELFRFSAYVAFYVLTVQLLSRKEELKRTVTMVIIFASVLSVVSILTGLFPNGKIFWLFPVTSTDRPFPIGPFVNRNHYAGLMEMVFPVALGMFLALKPRVQYTTLRERLAELFNKRETNNYLLTGFFAVVIAVSVFVSLSRGGIIGLSLSMIFFGAMLLRKERTRKRGMVIIAMFLIIVLAVGWFGWEPIFQRFERITDEEGNIAELRPTLWSDSLRIVKDFPLTGTGFGSFLSIYQKYRSIPGERTADHAENDYLELLVEGGVVGVVLAAWFFIALFREALTSFSRRKDSYAKLLFYGGTSGIIAILIHSLTDFNLHIGSNGLYFFFLCGLAVSAANTRLREQEAVTYLPSASPGAVRYAAVPVALFFGISLVLNIGITIADRFSVSFKELKLRSGMSEQELNAVQRSASRASFFDPLDGSYRSTQGQIASLRAHNDAALAPFISALAMDPLNGDHLQNLGIAYAALARNEKAEQLLKLGIAYDRCNSVRYKTYALWLLGQGRKDEALASLAAALVLVPHRTRDYITLMILSGFTDDEIGRALPRRVAPHLAFGSYLSRIGRDAMAEEAYLKALQYIESEKNVPPTVFYEVARYYTKRERFEDALRIVQRGIMMFPDHAGMRYNAGTLYERLDMTYRAIDAYRKTLHIDPAHREAKQRLSILAPEKDSE